MDEPTIEGIHRAKESQRTVNAYHRIFKSDDGKRVIDDISKVFGLHMPAFIAKPDGGFDTHHAAKRDGQADVLKHIQAKLSAKCEGDGIEKPKKRKVIR